jgi:calcineurin-like phosphoesterase
MKVAEGRVVLHGVVVDLDETTGRARGIRRLAQPD